jgi:hypothetical protein
MARSFNGSSDYIRNATVTALNVAANHTIAMSMWAYFPVWPTTVNTQLASMDSASSITPYGMNIDGSVADNIDFGCYTFGVVAASFNATTAGLVSGVWCHLYGDYNGSAWNIYFNGVLKNTNTTATGPRNQSGGFTMGAAFVGGSPLLYCQVRLGDVAVWTTNLSQIEISALAKGARPKDVRSGSLVGWWPLDGLQSPEPDLSGNAYNGTLTGTTAAFGPPFMQFTPRWPQFQLPPAPPSFILMPQIVM